MDLPETAQAEYATPSDWHENFHKRVDFEAAFRTLDGHEHFHAETLRGKIRSLQLRTKEASKHFLTAMLLSKAAKKNAQTLVRILYLHSYMVQNALLHEALHSPKEIAVETELTMEKFLDLEDPDLLHADQVRILVIGFYQLFRGNFHSALEAFECLIEESKNRVEDRQVDFFIGATAAHLALGHGDQAERHYQNASLALNTVSKLFLIALAYSRLIILTRVWDRADEADKWLTALTALPIPEASKIHFLRFSKALADFSSSNRRIAI